MVSWWHVYVVLASFFHAFSFVSMLFRTACRSLQRVCFDVLLTTSHNYLHETWGGLVRLAAGVPFCPASPLQCCWTLKLFFQDRWSVNCWERDHLNSRSMTTGGSSHGELMGLRFAPILLVSVGLFCLFWASSKLIPSRFSPQLKPPVPTSSHQLRTMWRSYWSLWAFWCFKVKADITSPMPFASRLLAQPGKGYLEAPRTPPTRLFCRRPKKHLEKPDRLSPGHSKLKNRIKRNLVGTNDSALLPNCWSWRYLLTKEASAAPRWQHTASGEELPTGVADVSRWVAGACDGWGPKMS